jgi:hypothetical protein
MSDVFGVGGRAWLETLELPPDERETMAGCLRQVDFLDREVDAIERGLARMALASAEIRRLMSVPGVNLVSAATFWATVGDIRRFQTPRKLVSYVGLDPKVRQSGEAPARHGHISKQGSAAARHMLCEAAWIVVRTPGPLRAFYERVRARRGTQIALVATARKLCVLFWHLLTDEEDYAFGRPSLTRHKLRRLELIAGDPSHRGRRSGSRRQSASSATSASSPSGSSSPTAASSTTGSRSEAVRVRHGGAHLEGISKRARQRGRDQPQNLRFSSSSPAPRVTLPERRVGVHRT